MFIQSRPSIDEKNDVLSLRSLQACSLILETAHNSLSERLGHAILEFIKAHAEPDSIIFGHSPHDELFFEGPLGFSDSPAQSRIHP
jgi:hypothetical protein